MRKTLIVILAVVIVLTIGVAYFGAGWVENRIEKEIQSISFLSYDSLSINVSERLLLIYNLEASKAGYQGTIELLEVQGLQLIPILVKKKFIVNSVSVSGLELSYQLKQTNQKQKTTSKSDESKKDDIPSFNIKSMSIEDAFFRLLGKNESTIFSTQLIASLENLGREDVLKPSSIPNRLMKLQLDSSRYFTKGGLYTLNVSRTIYRDEELKVTDIMMVSNKEKYEFGKYVGYELEWFDVKVDSLLLKLSNMASLLKRPQVHKMEIYRPTLKAFRDKRLPFPHEQRPPLLRDILSNDKITFAFDSISIFDGNIEYEVFVKEEKGPGVISFNDLNATITGMSSYSLGSQQKPRLVANCKLYGKSNLYADVSFPDSPTSKDTWVKGKLLNTDLTMFNRMIQYVSVIEIKSGKSEFLEFDFLHNDSTSTGEMKFAYTDLAISFLEKQEAEPKGFFNSVKSFFVNSFVIDSNNNFETDKFRIGKIDFERDHRKSIFNFWSGSILSGFKSSTGVDASGEKIDNN